MGFTGSRFCPWSPSNDIAKYTIINGSCIVKPFISLWSRARARHDIVRYGCLARLSNSHHAAGMLEALVWTWHRMIAPSQIQRLNSRFRSSSSENCASGATRANIFAQVYSTYLRTVICSPILSGSLSKTKI